MHDQKSSARAAEEVVAVMGSLWPLRPDAAKEDEREPSKPARDSR